MALSLDQCVLCLTINKSTDHLWHRLFNIANLDWVPPRGIAEMLGIPFKGFGSLPKREDSLASGCFYLIWLIGLERNVRIFKDGWRLVDAI